MKVTDDPKKFANHFIENFSTINKGIQKSKVPPKKRHI